MTIETDVLIVGIGPSGGSLSTFLGHLGGVKAIMISKYNSLATTPRAHITNMAALECLRDVGLEYAAKQVATPLDLMRHTRYAETFLGRELGRVYSWGTDPIRKGSYELASPCEHCDIPQTLLEPLLLKEATFHRNITARFDTEWVSCVEDADGVTSTVRDRMNGNTYQIRSKYLIGCDGAKSKVVEHLQLPFDTKSSGGTATNVHFRLDLEDHMRARISNLSYLYPVGGKPYPKWAEYAICRMIVPWSEWIMILFPSDPNAKIDASKEEVLKRTKELLGDENLPIDLISISQWVINESVATNYQRGRIIGLGDACHRHPPINGLGSNTCIQDAYNLAWKIAYVIKGIADPKLLETYTTERAPVGASIVKRANDGLRDHARVREVLCTDQEPAIAKQAEDDLFAPTPRGAAKRAEFWDAIEGTKREFHALGTEMNQFYQSDAIYADDEAPKPEFTGDPIFDYEFSTYPGKRLPHVWLCTLIPSPKVSTQDVAGKGRFTLFTGSCGKAWLDAVEAIAKESNIPIKGFSIGFGDHCTYTDSYGEWRVRSEVEDDGCVLVRPDRVVCWRSKNAIDQPKAKLETVLKKVLQL